MAGERRPFAGNAPLPVTMTVAQFKQISGLGKTKIYELLDSGKLHSTRVCGRRLILVQSYINLLGRAQLARLVRSLDAAAE
jgi:hypothetical protein